MANLNVKNNYKFIIVNVLFALFPLSFILGNLFINSNLVLFFIFVFYYYYKDLIKLKFNLFDKLITLFFVYTFLVLIVKFLETKFNAQSFNSLVLYKTFFYLRYYLLYISLRILLNQNLINFKYFFSSCAFFSIFVCIDIFFQYNFEKDIFGLKTPIASKLSGPFGDELIAGGFIQRFFLFSLFVPLVLKQKNLYKVLIQLLLLSIFFLGIALSGNRMPLLLFLISILFLFVFSKDLRKYLILIVLILSIAFSLLYYKNKTFNYNIGIAFVSVKNLIDVFYLKNITLEQSLAKKISPYTLEFYCFNYVWEKNIFLGGGVKSYQYSGGGGCNQHPHNYYFEILSDLGIFGFLIIATLFYFILFKTLKKYRFNFDNDSTNTIFPFFLVFFTEFFPIRTSGSFFSTGNAAFIFIILGLLVSLIDKPEKNDVSLDKKLRN